MTNGVYHGTAPGYNVHGSLNVPLSDTLAMRVSGFSREDPGYIHNVLFNERSINDREVYGGNVALLWELAAAFSANLSAI